ncbi:hypothetical protein ARSEF1564_007596 [Beauveria bassiana]
MAVGGKVKDYFHNVYQPGERALIQKIDFFILTFCCLSYFVNYLDRSNLNNAYVSGMKDDLGFVGDQLTQINTCFTVGYVVGQIPSNLSLHYVKPRIWFPLMMVLWGGLTMVTASTHNPQSIMAIRFFQGICEASTFVGTHYILGAWYTERELGKRSGIFTSSGLAGTMIGGFIQTGLNRGLDGRGGLAGWRWLFIIDGLITMPVALYGFVFFPDTPQTTRAFYLTEEEKALARSRVPQAAEDGQSPMTLAFVKKVLTSWYWWGFVMLWVIAGETESFSSNALLALYMQKHPVNTYTKAQLNDYPTGVPAVGIVSTLFWATLTDFLGGKRYLVGYWIGITGIATSIMILVASNNPTSSSSTSVVFAAYYWAGSVYACQATFFAWCNDAMRFEASVFRGVVLAGMNLGNNAVNAWWILIFYGASRAPWFIRGMCSVVVARIKTAPRVAAGLSRSFSTSPRHGQAVAEKGNEKAVKKDDVEDDAVPDVDEAKTLAVRRKHAAQLSKNEPEVDNSTGGLLRLLSIARPEAKPLGLATVFLAVSATITMTIPYAVGRIIDAAGKAGVVDVAGHSFTLTQFILGMGTVLTIGSAASFTRNIMMRIIGERVIARLRSRLYRRTYTQDAEFFDVNPVGDLISRLGSDVNIVGDSVTTSVTYALRSTFNTIAGISIMLWTSAKLTMLMLVILPPMAVGSLIYGRFVEKMSKRVQKNLGTLTKIAEERLGNVKTSQAFVGERQEVHRYNQQIRKVFALRKREGIVTSTFYTSTLWAGNISFLIMLTVGNSFIQSGAMTTGDLTAFVMYAMFAGTGMMDFFYTYTEIMRGSGAAHRLFELSDKKPRIPQSAGARIASAQGTVKFTNVHFAYPTRPDAKIFNGLNFEIPSGSNACIVGPSGRGKSTIGTLLQRFYDPVAGTITINGQDISQISVKSLRRRIGVVAQEPVLFSGTIAENIAYGVPGATEAEILHAAKVANCTFIDNLPKGLQTQVGARGSQLSGGQKQRVAIARAVLKRPDILILDEATSALDAESETLVNQALGRLFQGSMTTISIAHRLSTIEKADLLIVLNADGEVAEIGSYRELSANKDSEFSKLMENQMRSPMAGKPADDVETIMVDEEAVEEAKKRET